MSLGIFVAKGDVGVGTIVGSAVFNIVCVIGMCGMFVNGVSFRLKNKFYMI
jgi:Ca2+/Na+ antiporter